MKITLDLTDEAAQSYAQFYGNEDPEAVEVFVTEKLLSSITNDLTEKRNRDALVAVQEEPLPSVVNLEAQQTKVEEFISENPEPEIEEEPLEEPIGS